LYILIAILMCVLIVVVDMVVCICEGLRSPNKAVKIFTAILTIIGIAAVIYIALK